MYVLVHGWGASLVQRSHPARLTRRCSQMRRTSVHSLHQSLAQMLQDWNQRNEAARSCAFWLLLSASPTWWPELSTLVLCLHCPATCPLYRRGTGQLVAACSRYTANPMSINTYISDWDHALSTDVCGSGRAGRMPQQGICYRPAKRYNSLLSPLS